MLITTRRHGWRGFAVPLPIDVFPEAVAVEFLLTRSDRKDAEGAARPAHELGCLPLALDHAGAYCSDTGMRFDDYRRHVVDLIKTNPETGAGLYSTSVYGTFTLALDKAIMSCPQSEKPMGLFAFLAPDAIPLDLVADEAMSLFERSEAVAALGRVSLLKLSELIDGAPPRACIASCNRSCASGSSRRGMRPRRRHWQPKRRRMRFHFRAAISELGPHALGCYLMPSQY
ncbi:MAG: hypothetical protein ACREC6_11005 [Hyphomicrobiaceae bacterium]